MGVESYMGVPGICVDIQSKHDILEAIDNIHTQAMDRFGEDSQYLRPIEACMDHLRDLGLELK